MKQEVTTRNKLLKVVDKKEKGAVLTFVVVIIFILTSLTALVFSLSSKYKYSQNKDIDNLRERVATKFIDSGIYGGMKF